MHGEIASAVDLRECHACVCEDSEIDEIAVGQFMIEIVGFKGMIHVALDFLFFEDTEKKR